VVKRSGRMDCFQCVEMCLKVVYDILEKRLICYKKNPDPVYWDQHWSDSDILRLYSSLSKYNLIQRATKKYIHPKDGPILEGGCGTAQFVYLLSEAGYKCVGVDTAEETIKKVKKVNPSLCLKVMDVRKLEFPDNYFAGYWSLGVIEHFFKGYNQILNEMYRVVKPGGFVFVTVPKMSNLRKLKAFWGLYENLSSNEGDDLSPDNFYQFILSHDKVVSDFKRKGLELVETHNKGGIKGLQDEISILKYSMQFLVKLRAKNVFSKSVFKVFDNLLSPITGHMGFYVCKKLIG